MLVYRSFYNRLKISSVYVVLLAPTSVTVTAVCLQLKFPHYVSRDASTVLLGRLHVQLWCVSRVLVRGLGLDLAEVVSRIELEIIRALGHPTMTDRKTSQV